MNSSGNRNNKAGALLVFSFPKGMILERQVSDLDLQALADGELGAEEKRAVMAAVLKSPALLDRLDELLRQKNLIRDCSYQGHTEH